MASLLIFTLLVGLAALIMGLVSGTIQSSITVNGVTGNTSTSVTAETNRGVNPDVPAAKGGTLTTRTNGTSGSITGESGHGITTGQVIDIYWDGGQCYGAVVGTVSGTTIPISSVAGGDALPIATTVLTLGIREAANFPVVGDDMKALVMACSSSGYFSIEDGSGVLFAKYVTPTTAYGWLYGSGVTNPIAGDTATKVNISQRSSSSISTGSRVEAAVA